MRKTFAEIAARWNRCEKLLKTAERLRGEVNLPAINELRYAGRRIADALAILVEADPDQEARDQARILLNESYHFCMRAEHDCVDSIVLYAHLLIKEYDKSYDRDMLHQVCGGLKTYRATKQNIDDLIISSRENREKRDDIYQIIIEQHLPAIISIAEELEEARDVLDTEYAKRLKRYQDMERKAAISLWVGVAGFIAGLVGIAISLR